MIALSTFVQVQTSPVHILQVTGHCRIQRICKALLTSDWAVSRSAHGDKKLADSEDLFGRWGEVVWKSTDLW